MAIDLNKMKQKLASAQGNGGGKSDFWKITEGEHTVRLLPSEDGDPFREFWFHYNVGTHNGFLCPKRNFGDNCPVCEFATRCERGRKGGCPSLGIQQNGLSRTIGSCVEP